MKKFFIVVLILLIAFSGVTLYFWQGFKSFVKEPLGLQQELVVAKGETATGLGQQWYDEGRFENFYYYQLLMRMKPELRNIKVGNYQVTPEMTAVDVLQKLVKGDVITYQVTLVEGANIYEVLTALADNSDLTHTIDTTNYSDTWEQLDFTGKDYPEGLFFADTYQFTKGDSDLDILRRAHKRLNQVLEEEWANRAKDLPYEQPYEALIMASIVEKETAVPAERSQISGVFIRRLERGMLLQTDPTIIYGLLPDFDGNIRRRDIRNPHQWNTYVHKGLPPTPIAIVGRDAIHAAMQPEEGDTLYFVAKGDGSHHFSKTLSEHNRAVRKYQLNR
ncbi:endolytic transglycosylase MltG [Kangiella sediminilitoris]|uniref:Endolytic murein transglycosylase n=1 Tax=Kangiella sediminilitoris TaxID=1144748 RepID=A0A1B3BAJ6_9GAMM|nr:endolytic transglycosylase MltG [Kangiella sediminilitoris]AOE49811.1 Aminodeoxychorismate lyase [Kangiella sediminilitoris]